MPKGHLFLIAVLALALTASAAFVALPSIAFDEDGIPEARLALAQRLTSRPLDWPSIVRIDESSLDWQLPQRLPLWRAAHTLARRYAPTRDNGDVAFVKAGLFHWLELEPADQRAMVEASTRLLRDPQYFNRLYRPIFELTRDVGVLRRGNPGTISTTFAIAQIAVVNGQFDDYRALRSQLVALRAASIVASSRQLDVLGNLGTFEWSTRDQAGIIAALQKLSELPLDEERGSGESVDRLFRYANAHHLQPLDGLEAFAKAEGYVTDPIRARIALATGNLRLADQIAGISSGSESKDWAPYHAERAQAYAAAKNLHDANAEVARALSAELPEAYVACMRVADAGRQTDVRDRCAGELETRFGTATWTGLCGNDICTQAVAPVWAATAKTLVIPLREVQADEYAPYVELYVDDAPAGEGEIAPQKTFTIALAPGLHTVRVRLANPLTRNQVARRITFSP